MPPKINLSSGASSPYVHSRDLVKEHQKTLKIIPCAPGPSLPRLDVRSDIYNVCHGRYGRHGRHTRQALPHADRAPVSKPWKLVPNCFPTTLKEAAFISLVTYPVYPKPIYYHIYTLLCQI